MKKLLALTLPSLLLCACSPQQADAAGESSAQASAAPESSAQAPAAAQLAQQEAAQQAAEPQRDINAKNIRYTGGLDRMDSEDDMAAMRRAREILREDEAVKIGSDDHAGHDHDGDGHDDHAGHDHDQTPQETAAALAAQNQQQNQGRIGLADGITMVKDFGKMRQGDIGEYEFVFVSEGTEPLVVTGVKPSCGCTKAELSLIDAEGERTPYVMGNPIPVGERFGLASQINTDGRNGRFNANISIYANDARGTFTVRLTADIEPVLTVKPSTTVYFGRITTADQVEQEVTVTTTQGELFKLEPTQDPVKPMQVELTPVDPDAEGRSSEWRIKVVLGPNTEPGMRNYPLNFKSDLVVANPKYPSPDGTPQYHMFMLNTQAQVTGMVSAEPTFITFGMVRPGEPVERSLRLEVHDDFQLPAELPVTFEGLQGQLFPYADALKVSVEPLPDGKSADLKVVLDGLPDDLNGSLGGVMRLKVGHPYMDELEIRFSAVCRPGVPVPARGGQK